MTIPTLHRHLRRLLYRIQAIAMISLNVIMRFVEIFQKGLPERRVGLVLQPDWRTVLQVFLFPRLSHGFDKVNVWK